MSVIETNKIDGIGKEKDNKVIAFMISDHLDWKKEDNHLITLQNKINSYLAYIEAKEYKDIYPGEEFESYIIQIHFKYKITNRCRQFLDVAQEQLNKFNIKFVIIEVNT